ncbi:MAG: hypothetical protein Q9163_002086 [Psora crenata]
MDIRSLIDTDDTSTARNTFDPPVSKQAPRSSQEIAVDTIYGQRAEVGLQLSERPRQHLSLQTLGHQDSRYLHRSPYGSGNSPNQQPHFDRRIGVTYPSPQQYAQSPPNTYHPAQYFPQDTRSCLGAPAHHNPGPSTPISHTPTESTPGSAGAYSSWQRPTSSHSASTPTSAQPMLFSQTPTGQNGSLAHFIPSHHMSPQMSGPLGPPSTRPRPMDIRRDSLSSGSDKRSLSGELRLQQRLDGHPQAVFRSPTVNGSPPSQSRFHYERARSVSVSPKTRLASLPPAEPIAPAQAYNGTRNGPYTPPDMKGRTNTSGSTRLDEAGVRPSPHRSTSLGIQDLLNEEPQPEVAERLGNRGFRNLGNEVSESLACSMTASSELSLNEQSPSELSNRGPSKVDSRSENLQITNPTHVSLSDQTLTHTSGRQSPMPENNQKSSPRKLSDIARREITISGGGIDSSSPQEPTDTHTTDTTRASNHSDPGRPMPENNQKSSPRTFSDIARREIAISGGGIDSSSPQEPTDTHTTDTTRASNHSDPGPQESTLASAAPTLPSEPAKKKPRVDSKNIHHHQEQANDVTLSEPMESSPPQIRKKPPRMPTPVFAQSVRDTEPSRKYGNIKPVPPQRGSADLSRQQQLRGHLPANCIPLRASQPTPLGHWEPSILNIIPTDEVVKVVSDFLFTQVLTHDSIGVAPAGGSAGRGAVLEIEAKIGRIIDKNTTDRLQLPVLTETVLNRDHPNMRTNFESSMTEAQHRALNGFLNNALIATQAAKPTPQNPKPPPNNRVRMKYKHTKETDTFYELSQSGLLALPRSITSISCHPRSGVKTKVRITHDQKTGQELAKIVKARIADVDVYSPQNQADWRVSVNVEMDFQGDMKDLVEVEKKDGKRADRSKDRMSYQHQAYQIDLTQVTPAEGTLLSDREHELEVEVSSEEVRRQATLLQRGEINQFAVLIAGFVDNVRMLARQVPVDNYHSRTLFCSLAKGSGGRGFAGDGIDLVRHGVAIVPEGKMVVFGTKGFFEKVDPGDVADGNGVGDGKRGRSVPSRNFVEVVEIIEDLPRGDLGGSTGRAETAKVTIRFQGGELGEEICFSRLTVSMAFFGVESNMACQVLRTLHQLLGPVPSIVDISLVGAGSAESDSQGDDEAEYR